MSVPTNGGEANDVALRPFLAASSEPEARRCLEALLEKTDPVIAGILRARWRTAGRDGERELGAAEEARGEVLQHLLVRLASLKGGETEPIGNFRGFVATTAYRVCDSALRKRYPRRACLKNRLRYLLTERTNQKGFALWEGPGGERLCGFAAWRSRSASAASPAARQLLDHPQAHAAGLLPGEDLQHANLAVVVAAVFNRVAGPLALDDLVNVVAALLRIEDRPDQELDAPAAEGGSAAEQLADPRADSAREVLQRAHLQHLWSEVRQLPPRQATALLLNLRDAEGKGVIALLPLRGIASLRELAAAMELPPERFADLWHDLPLEDNAIADLLGCTRQQVINLRKVARERLARRMKEW